MLEVTASSQGQAPYRQTIMANNHTFYSDVSPDKGGQDTAPDPHQLLMGSWGACTAMTIQMYAYRKGWPLSDVSVTIREESRGARPVFRKFIRIAGDLTSDQLERLKAIAEKCPVNQLITGDKASMTVESILEAV